MSPWISPEVPDRMPALCQNHRTVRTPVLSSHRSVEGHRFPPQGLQFRYKRSQAHRRPHNRNLLFQKWRIHHFPEPAPQLDLLIACINLMEKCLLVIKVLIAVLIHLCVVFPVVLVHPFDFFLTCFYGIIQLSDPVTQSFCHMCKIFPSVFTAAIRLNPPLPLFRLL